MLRNLIQGFRYTDADERPHPTAAFYMAGEHENAAEKNCLMPGLWVLDYSISGKFEFRVDELDWRPRPPGIAHLYPPGKRYYERDTPGRYSSCYYLFKGENAFLRTLVNNSAGFAQIADPERKLEQTVRNGVAASANGNTGYWKFCEAFDRAMQLLESLSMPDGPDWHYTLIGPGCPVPLAVRIREYLEQHYREPVSLKMLARKFHCSQSTLEHQFKQTWQESIFNSLLRIRVEQSVPLLLNHAALKEVAEATGFCNEFYFSRVFRKIYGISPRNYLKNELRPGAAIRN